MNISINITNRDGSCHSLEQKDHIKYLGVMIDSSLSWKYHISYVQSTLSKADTLGTRFTVRLREVSALERVHLT